MAARAEDSRLRAEERGPGEAAQRAPSARTAGLQNCEQMPFCCSSHQAVALAVAALLSQEDSQEEKEDRPLIQMEEQPSLPHAHHPPADTESQGLPGHCRVRAGQRREGGCSG